MACMKCGSDWATTRGKDMVSCPECCKQQRCKARKQGRLPTSEIKTCERCGQQFEAVGGNAVARSRECRLCAKSDANAGERRRRYRERVKEGLKVPGKKTTEAKQCECQCCGKSLSRSNQKKYCSRLCFYEARRSGKQTWRHNVHPEAVWHRGGLWASAPSRKPVQEMRTNLTAFLSAVKKAYSRAAAKQKACEICGEDCYGPEARFCSLACLSKSVREAFCYKCGKPCRIKGVSSKGTCEACRRLVRKLHRKKYGNHSRRARHHGVKCVRFPRKMIFERDGYRCQICGRKTLRKVTYRKSDGKIHPRSPTVDCIVAMANGGNYEPPNCQTACFICNSRKSDSGGGQLRLAISSGPTYQGGRKSGRGT